MNINGIPGGDPYNSYINSPHTDSATTQVKPPVQPNNSTVKTPLDQQNANPVEDAFKVTFTKETQEALKAENTGSASDPQEQPTTNTTLTSPIENGQGPTQIVNIVA